jgi:predicted hotdog family 3-hydroxylacyl-ACP dehydratase
VIIFDRQQISSMIPHAGAMCLLDAVLSWNPLSVRCLSCCHQWENNPLRRTDGKLGALGGVEIAAQAMAVHGWLVAGRGGPQAQGYLASLRDVHLRRGRLDGIEGDIIVDAARLMGDTQGATYRFVLTGDSVELLDGRATVLFGTPG